MLDFRFSELLFRKLKSSVLLDCVNWYKVPVYRKIAVYAVRENTFPGLLEPGDTVTSILSNDGSSLPVDAT
jgi:hypothetical protein